MPWQSRHGAEQPTVSGASGQVAQVFGTYRYARHARTWPTALATRRHNDHFGTQWKRSSDDGAADHNGAYARPKPRRQSRYVIRLPAILAELCRIVHR